MALQEFSLNNEDLALTSIFDSAALLESAKDLAQSQLQGFAQSQDFNDRIGSAFGQGRDVNKLRDIWLTGKISFPAIEVRSKSELGGAYGAFSQETGKIYLAQELINTNSKALISSVLLEEYGHFVDTQVNVVDSAGDEGEIFSGILQGKVFEPEQIQQLKAKDDHATIALDSQVLQVEQAIFPLREGGKEGKTETITLDAKGPGAAQIFYQMFGVPDRLQLRYEGKVIFDSGFTSGSKTTRFNIPAGNSNKLDVVLTANPSISTTRWQYKIDTTTARDPLPLQVSLVSGTRDEKNGKRIAEGIVYIGRQGFFPMLKVEGRVEYDDKTISVDGIVSSLIGSAKVKATPLFKSKFNIDVKTATGSLQEDSSFGNQFKLGGLVDIDFSSLSLKPSGLTFGAKFNLGKVGNAGLPDFFFGGSNTLSISQNDAKFGASVKLSLPNFKAEDYEKVNKKLFEFLPLKEFSNISLEYVGSEDKIKIQGKVVIAPFVKLAKQKKNIDFIADFAGDNFIQIQNGKVDVKGSLAVESNIKAANGWGLSELKLDIDTQNKDIGGSAKIVFPFGAKFPPNSAVAAFGLGFKLPIPPLQLNKVSVEFDDLQVPAIIFDGVPVVFFQRLSGSVENFAPSDPDLTEFSGGIGATLGPQIKIGSEKFSLIRLDVDGTISSEQLSATGKVIIINKKNEVRESTATVNWVKRFFELKGNFTFLDGLIKAKASFKTDFKFNITMSGTASAGIPKSVPLVGGSQIASGNFLFNFSNDNNLSNDSITVWNTLDIQKGFEAKFASGVKYYLDGRSEALFKNLPRVGSWAVAANTPWIILSADWENELGTNVPVQIETPDGRLINESEFAANNIAFVDELTNSKTKTVIIFNPSEGIWDIEVPNKTGLGAINYNAVTNSQAPTIAITAPVTDVTGQNATISYNAFDSDSNATVSLFYDNDNQGFDGILIKDGLAETDGAGSFVWNTEGIATGDYYVYAMVLDENNAPAFSYSTGRVSVTEQADLSIDTTVNADSVILGTNLTYTITVTNNGTSTAKGITLTDVLPVGVTFVSASITPSEQVDGNLTFDLGNLENGKTTTVSITITPSAVGTLTNTATVTSKTYDPDITNDTTISDSTVTVAKPLSPDLVLSSDASNTPVNLGDQITYTLTVTNNGDGQATGVQLIDDIGSLGVKDVLIKTSQGTTSIDSDGNVIVELGNLNKGEKATVTITATSIVADILTSTASVTSNEESLNIDNTFLIQNKSVNAINLTSADLELTQIVDNPNPKIGDEINFTLTLTNKGVGIASGIQVQDILSSDLDFVSALPEQGTYDSQTGIWDVGNMRDNLTTTLKITAKVNKLGAITNTAEVIAVAETDPDSTPNNNNPNEDDQASLTLNTALAIPSLTKIADDIFTISGGTAGKPKLQITISDSNPKSVNDLAVFTVDDAQGRINGIAPTETGYTQAALSRAKNIFSAIANLPNGFDPKTLSRSLEFNSGDNLRFLLVKNDTLDNVRKKNVSNPNILFSNAANQKITDSGTGNFTLAWKDGSGNSSDFKDFVVNIQSTDTPLPLGANLQDQQQGEVLDLRSVDSTKTVQANFVVNREASYNNFVGFYKITDSQGTIADPLTGLFLKPGDTGYTEAAIKNRVAGIDLQAANQSTATINGVFQGGSIFAPFIIANGSVNQLLDADKSNDPSVYFAYLGANSDGVDHIRLLANNTFGFEDLAGGGDFDYNDIIIKANLSVA